MRHKDKTMWLISVIEGQHYTLKQTKLKGEIYTAHEINQRGKLDPETD